MGVATNIPPHNLSEVVEGLVALVRDPDISVAALMQHIPGPDFPTGGRARMHFIWPPAHLGASWVSPAGGRGV